MSSRGRTIARVVAWALLLAVFVGVTVLAVQQFRRQAQQKNAMTDQPWASRSGQVTVSNRGWEEGGEWQFSLSARGETGETILLKQGALPSSGELLEQPIPPLPEQVLLVLTLTRGEEAHQVELFALSGQEVAEEGLLLLFLEEDSLRLSARVGRRTARFSTNWERLN